MALSLDEAVAEPELGSEALPTVGSVGHRAGLCKPCAFVAKGCESGVECTFCHLCDPGEKERRKKEKKKQMSQWRQGLEASVPW